MNEEKDLNAGMPQGEGLVLRTEGLVKRYGKRTVVNDVSINVKQGEIVGLLGPNGAGKTTLFRLMLDLLKSDEGYVHLIYQIEDENQSIDPAKSEEWKPFTGAYIDEGFLIDFLTPEEYFEFVAKVNNIPKEQLYEQLASFHDFMGDEIMGQKKLIRDFSAGNKQKIGIVGAMINRPQLLVLDDDEVIAGAMHFRKVEFHVLPYHWCWL